MVSLSMMARLLEAVRPVGPARAGRRPPAAGLGRGRRRARRHRGRTPPIRTAPMPRRRSRRASPRGSWCCATVHRFAGGVGELAARHRGRRRPTRWSDLLAARRPTGVTGSTPMPQRPPRPTTVVREAVVVARPPTWSRRPRRATPPRRLAAMQRGAAAVRPPSRALRRGDLAERGSRVGSPRRSTGYGRQRLVRRSAAAGHRERLQPRPVQRRHGRGRRRPTARCAAPSNAGARSSTCRPAGSSAVETLYAMTIHKSQGSQFGQVVVVLPDETRRSSPASCCTPRSPGPSGGSPSSAPRPPSAPPWRGRSAGRRAAGTPLWH